MPGLLERGAYVDALVDLLDEARSTSRGRLAVIAGEAGVGKTALLRGFCEGHASGTRVLWAGCEPLRTARPLGPFLDVAEAVGGEFHELVTGAAEPHDVALALLRTVRGRRVTVLVVEDVNWADEATLDVLTLLAPRVGSVPALVLVSYRDDERGASAQLRTLLAEVGGGPGRLRVAPLSQGAVTELAAPHGVDGPELFRRTGGNPFFVAEALAAPGEHLPETVRDAVLARSARLPEAARALLGAVAVVPGQVDVRLLEELAGELVDHLQTCLDSGILDASGPQVRFRHELARLTIEESMSPARRVALHRRALVALVERGADLARLVHHAEAAGDGEAVLRWAPAAAERAASSGAHREAAEHYALALDYGGRLPLGERAALLHRRVQECWMTDQFEAARAAQRELLDCQRRRGDRAGEGDALRMLARLLAFASEHEESERLARAAVEVLEPLPARRELAMAYGGVAEERWIYHDLEGARLWGGRCIELATHLDDAEALVYGLQSIGAAELQTGLQEGELKLERALALARDSRLHDGVGRTYAVLVRCDLRLRHFDTALERVTAGLAYCEERGLETWRMYMYASGSRAQASLGRWDEATASAALALRDPLGAPSARVWALAALGLVRARRGDPDAAAALHEAQAVVEGTGQLEWTVLVAGARAELAWLAGDPAAVAAVTDAALALALECAEPWSIAELGFWRWKAGLRDDLPAVSGSAAGADTGDGAGGEPYRLAMSGDWAAAAERWRALGCPYEAALALAGADDEEALRRAHDELAALGAGPATAIVARSLRERGARGVPRGPRPRTRANPAGLTARELEVLALLGEGLRNAEIAQRLVVSEKTASHHTSAVLRKLGVRSRAEAAAAAARMGMTGTPDEPGEPGAPAPALERLVTPARP
ncbi:MAG TPA: LuxR C-terminal-related transcriptional regulator [Solirubrobacteraceae bacterium]|nr:LuxR C-terminal-related transcriptional regulator [Solirubrobacteraceae bacterium]